MPSAPPQLRLPDFLPEDYGINLSLFSDFGTLGRVDDKAAGLRGLYCGPSVAARSWTISLSARRRVFASAGSRRSGRSRSIWACRSSRPAMIGRKSFTSALARDSRPMTKQSLSLRCGGRRALSLALRRASAATPAAQDPRHRQVRRCCAHPRSARTSCARSTPTASRPRSRSQGPGRRAAPRGRRAASSSSRSFRPTSRRGRSRISRPGEAGLQGQAQKKQSLIQGGFIKARMQIEQALGPDPSGHHGRARRQSLLDRQAGRC